MFTPRVLLGRYILLPSSQVASNVASLGHVTSSLVLPPPSQVGHIMKITQTAQTTSDFSNGEVFHTSHWGETYN